MWYFAGIPIVAANHAWFSAVMVFTCLAFMFTLMRAVSRGYLARKLGVDDYLMFLAMGLSIAWLASVIEQIKLGLGNAVRLDQLEAFLFWLWWTIIFYTWTQWIIKMSILAQYYRLFETEKPRKILGWMLVWFIAYGLVNNISPIFMCVPVQKYWNSALPGHCMNFYALHYVLSTFNVLNDLMLLIFPIPILVKLHMPLRIKIILIATFTTGLFATIVSMMRFNALVINASGALSTEPILGVQIVIWSGLEMNIAIACGSVPAVKPLFTLIFPSLNFKARTSAKPGARRIRSVSPLPSSSAKSGEARSWNPLSSLRKYGHGWDDSILRTTRHDVELEDPGAKNITVERSVEQASVPVASMVDYDSQERLTPWDVEHGR